MKTTTSFLILTALVSAIGLAGCATESSRAAPVYKPQAAARDYNGARYGVAVGKFDNRSTFMRGIFTDGVDQLGSQAKTILVNQLQQANRFNVMDRDNMKEIGLEAGLAKQTQALKGASEDLRDKFFKNLSERAATMIQEDLEIMGPIRLAEVEAAQQNVVKTVRRLEAEVEDNSNRLMQEAGFKA